MAVFELQERSIRQNSFLLLLVHHQLAKLTFLVDHLTNCRLGHGVDVLERDLTRLLACDDGDEAHLLEDRPRLVSSVYRLELNDQVLCFAPVRVFLW